eukprot:7286143-Alexandrium_andersonii.AAC.1
MVAFVGLATAVGVGGAPLPATTALLAALALHGGACLADVGAVLAAAGMLATLSADALPKNLCRFCLVVSMLRNNRAKEPRLQPKGAAEQTS